MNHFPRRLRGYPMMTANMMKVLNFLLDAKAQGWPFVALDGVHSNTIQALVKSELIFGSRDKTGIRYKITPVGELTRRVYQQPRRRNDRMCPSCGVRPRHVTQSGRLEGYCLECANSTKRRAYKLKRPLCNPNRMCSCCGVKPVYVTPKGRAISYCVTCANAISRRNKKGQVN